MRRVGARANLTIPAAIVIAGGTIAGGVYYGQRERAPIEVAPAPVAAPVAVSRELVARQAIEALAYHRPQLLARCYRAISPRRPAAFTFDVTFDAQGSQVMRGFVEAPGTSTPAITACVTESLPPLMIPPPGAVVMVEVPLQLP
jgi:hypothetical protein